MNHITRWSPDTCQCIIEYSWDDTVPQDQRTHTLKRLIQACPAHQAGTEQTVYDAVKEENPRKNQSLKEMLDNAPAAMFDEDGSGTRTFKNGISVDFSFTGTAPDRVLTLTVHGVTLTTPQKNAIQNKVDTRFGAGKVTIVQG